MRTALLLGIELYLFNASLAGGVSMEVTVDRSKGKSPQKTRACTVHELLPRPCQGKSSEWINANVPEQPYNCSCATMKGRYFCPTQIDSSYPMWEPRAVSEGVCRSKLHEDMIGAPLPPDTKFLFYGNSHLRQVMEAIMCIFQADVESKVISIGSPGLETTVPGDVQCRGCSTNKDPKFVSPLRQSLLDHQCIAESDICRCFDDHGEYMFDNGAVVHFQFSHNQKTKGLDDARLKHRMEDLSSYDAVFINQGNKPTIDAEQAIEIALVVQAAETQVFWLSTYDASSRISKWSKDQRARFYKSGALHVDIECMARGMKTWTKGSVEDVNDGHFCMPGPPDEMALLLLKIIWAMFEKNT